MSNVNKDLANLRREYIARPLRKAQLDDDPIRQFDLWFEEALAAEVMDANAMSVATVADGGQPSLRTVLLKQYDDSGFVFYTNLTSRKADEIKANSKVALLLYWHEVNRQVKICGIAERTSAAEDAEYFKRRPKDSQLAAWASTQSRVIASRSVLEQEFAALKARFADVDVPLPPFWGGFRIVPHSLEFWQGRVSRLHDCFEYQRDSKEAWNIERLAP